MRLEWLRRVEVEVASASCGSFVSDDMGGRGRNARRSRLLQLILLLLLVKQRLTHVIDVLSFLGYSLARVGPQSPFCRGLCSHLCESAESFGTRRSLLVDTCR